MKVQVASRTDVGRVRTNNEDNLLVDADNGLFVVCDGMGGHSAGEVASRLCCSTLQKELPALLTLRQAYEHSHNQTDIKALSAAVEKAMGAACKEIHKQASRSLAQHGMGTTCTMVLLAGHNKGIVAHVGDSRLYLLRGGQVHQLSEDHTYVNELVKRGALSRDKAQNHPQSNVLSRAMGVQPSVTVDTMIFDIDANDTFLLCSDGVYNYYSETQEIAKLLGEPEVDKAVASLVHNALERGGHDNCTAVVFRTLPPAVSAELDSAVAAQRRIAALQRIPIFAHLTYNELVKVLGLTQTTQLPAQTTFIREGQPGHEFFVILAGEVEVVRGGDVISTLGAGAHLGEMAMVDNAPRSATVTTRNEVSLMVMRRDEFFSIIRSEPLIASKLLWSFVKVLSGRLRESNEALHDARVETGPEVSEFDIFADKNG